MKLSMYKLNEGKFFFSRTENFPSGRQASAKSPHGFLGSEENVNLNKYFNTLGVLVLVSPAIFYRHWGKC